MIQTYQRLQRRRAAGEIDGFTLIELLIVIVVLGILAAIVVFALGGVTGKSAAAACQSDAKTVGVGVAALQAENPSYQAGGLTTANWITDMTAPSGGTTTPTGIVGTPYVQTWPSSSSYTVFVGGDANGATPTAAATEMLIAGNPLTATPTTTAATPIVYGDVYVISTAATGGTAVGDYYDATLNPIEACNFAVLGKA